MLEQERKAIEPGHGRIPIYRQCELLGLNRTSLYYVLCSGIAAGIEFRHTRDI